MNYSKALKQLTDAHNAVKAVKTDDELKAKILHDIALLKWRTRSDWELAAFREETSRSVRSLSSVADYMDAPVGTVVGKKFGDGFWRKSDGAWEDENDFLSSSLALAGAERWAEKWGDL